MASSTAAVSSRSSASSASSPAAATQVLEFIEAMTTNVDAVQERVLAEILGRNADSEYLLKCDLAGATDRAAFRAKVPMVTYEDLKPYIMRVADGDRSPILSGSVHPISEFFPSSGTSGGQLKLIPSVKDELDRRQLLYSFIMPVMSQFMPGIDKGKGLYFLFVRPEMKTAGGLLARPVLTSYYKSDHFKNHDACHTYTSPMAAILCEDTFESMYAQMVCGLCQRHAVLRVGAVFASGLLRAILFLQQHWEQLAADVDAGELSACVSDPSVREAVAAVVLQAPDPELAMAIRAECSKGDWAGIVTRIWHNAKYLDTIVTGSMAQYVPALNYYSGELPIASTRYVSSECPIGLNLRPICDPSEVSYTIMPNMAYFEFLPVAAAADDDDNDTATTACELVELAKVEPGREYELVVTTYGGLSRYRVGDVLRVTGFHNAAPEFRFARRKKVLLSIDADKTDEADLQRAVERASALLHRHGAAAAVLDYTSRTCAESVPGHYVVYWELLATKGTMDMDGGDGDGDGVLLSRCCLEMEEALSYVYRVLRVKDGTIGPLEIRVVRPGTFVDLADYSVSHGGASMGQYKVPRSVTVPAIVQLLDSRVVSRHFSPALPHWAPVNHFELDRENGGQGSA